MNIFRQRLARAAALIAWLMLPILPPGACAQEPAIPKKVLALHWYDRDYPGQRTWDQTLGSALRSRTGGTVQYFPEYLQSNTFPGRKQSEFLRDYLRRKYADQAIDGVVANSDASLQFFLEYADLFPRTPIVFHLTVAPPTDKVAASRNMTGVISGGAYRETLDLALRLHPKTEQVFVISGSLAGDKRLEEYARQQLQGYENRVGINYLTDLSPDELIAKVKTLPERSIILYRWQQVRDRAGKLLETVDVLALIAQSASVPIYGLSRAHVGPGAIGGYVVSWEASATRVAEMALRIANGARPQDIPVETAPAVPMFDWRELQRWGIGEDRLPPGSVIEFRELTFWDQYKSEIVAAVAFCLLQTLLIGALLVERSSRRKATKSLVGLNADLERSMSEIANLNGCLISAQEDERRRISLELHDDLSQQAAALGIRLSVIKRKLDNGDAAGDGLAAVQGGLMNLTSSIHALSHALHPALLERAGLEPAVRGHCEDFEGMYGINVHVRVELDRSVSPNMGLCLYRVIQEALRNIAKHSGAKEAWVSLAEIDHHLHLRIEDNGRGFDPGAISGNGIGIASMRERVRTVGGTIEVTSKPGRGTVTCVVAPIPVQEAAAGGGRMQPDPSSDAGVSPCSAMDI